jgi:hypothetical protein
MTQSKVSPDEVLDALKRDATTRTRNSLDIIYAICREQADAGSRDFSVATIGRLSSRRGGPVTQTIRNLSGEHFRVLLAAWASYVDGATRKPPVRPEPGVADDVLDMIPDASVRALVGSFLAENRRLKAENNLLKRQAQVVIDRRPPSKMSVLEAQTAVQVLSPLSNLLPVEVDALRHAISDELLQKMGWVVDSKTGRVSKGGLAVFRAGFVTAIRKVLDATGS